MKMVSNKVLLICWTLFCACVALAFPFNPYDIVSTNDEGIVDYDLR